MSTLCFSSCETMIRFDADWFTTTTDPDEASTFSCEADALAALARIDAADPAEYIRYLGYQLGPVPERSQPLYVDPDAAPARHYARGVEPDAGFDSGAWHNND